MKNEEKNNRQKSLLVFLFTSIIIVMSSFCCFCCCHYRVALSLSLSLLLVLLFQMCALQLCVRLQWNVCVCACVRAVHVYEWIVYVCMFCLLQHFILFTFNTYAPIDTQYSCVLVRVCMYLAYTTRETEQMNWDVCTHKHRIVRTVAVLTCKMDD